MDIQWFSKNLQGVVTIYETNITLNKISSNYFKDSYKTLIGFDKVDNILLIKSLNKEESVLSKYNDGDLHRISLKPSYGRINGKGIIKNICNFFPLDFSSKNLYKFECEWDASHKYLKVYLEREVS